MEIRTETARALTAIANKNNKGAEYLLTSGNRVIVAGGYVTGMIEEPDAVFGQTQAVPCELVVDALKQVGKALTIDVGNDSGLHVVKFSDKKGRFVALREPTAENAVAHAENKADNLDILLRNSRITATSHLHVGLSLSILQMLLDACKEVGGNVVLSMPLEYDETNGVFSGQHGARICDKNKDQSLHGMLRYRCEDKSKALVLSGIIAPCVGDLPAVEGDAE